MFWVPSSYLLFIEVNSNNHLLLLVCRDFKHSSLIVKRVNFSDLIILTCSMVIFVHGKNYTNCPPSCVSPAALPVPPALPVCLLTRVFCDPDDAPDGAPGHLAVSAPDTGPGDVGDSIHPQGSPCMSPSARRVLRAH